MTRTTDAATPDRTRAAVYVRISTDEAHQPWSLSAQRDRLDAYCASQGWLVAAVYVEQASGATLNRPQLERVLADAHADRFDVLVVIALDRLSRNLAQMMGLIERLEACGVALVSATQPFDTGTPTGRLLLQMLASFAEFERSLIVERVTAGTERRAKSGRWTSGRIPYGYTRHPDTRGLIPDPVTAPVVVEIFRLYAEDRVGTLTIAKRLNERGERTQSRKRWTPNTVTTVLRNRAYLGLVPWRGQHYPGQHDSLINQDVFDRAQVILQERAEHPSLRRGNQSDYLLSGVLRCAHCRSPYIGMGAHGHGGRYEYYVCQGRRRHGRAHCGNDPLPKRALETAVIGQLAILLADSTIFEDAWAKAQQAKHADTDRIRSEITRTEQKQRDRVATRNRYLHAFETGALDPSLLQDRLQHLDTQSSELALHLATLQAGLDTTTTQPFPHDTVRRHRDQLDPATDDPLDPIKLKALLRILIHRLTIHNRTHIQPTYRLPADPDAPPAEPVRPTPTKVGRAGLEPATLGLKVPCSTS